MKEATNAERPGATLTDPAPRHPAVDDLEAGLKEPVFENLEIPRRSARSPSPSTITRSSAFPSRRTITCPWYLQDGASPFDGARIGQLCLLGKRSRAVVHGRATAPARLSASIPKNRCGSTAP
ncbi:hypothetical protein L0Z14_30325 [Burkholderia multivorans]|uniref:hypothetical protein n=1 Tax=Burkholderia multivorans TaxID=87883 RepID=UPI00201B1CD1|nr:hypothetical protein [Burkholderia multivorans]MCL4665196.1 hypothetical protein [Burkholderia multivorans]